MNKTPEEEYRVVSVKKGRKGKTSAKSISLSLAEGVNMGGQGYREVESLPEVSKVEEVVLSGDISLAPSNTYNLSMSTKWQIDNNKPISVIVPSDADMTVFKQKYPNLLSASPYRYLNVSVG